MDAILGGMRLSLPSLKSGLHCYIAFVGACQCLFVCAHTCWYHLRGRKVLSRTRPAFPAIAVSPLGVVNAIPLTSYPHQLPGVRKNRLHARER